MNYSEVLEYISEKNKLGSVFGLDGIRTLLEKLGNPEKGIPAIHIGGTNGKGSIMAFVEETLIQAGYKVGRYISPTIYNYRERWMNCKVWASEEEVAEAMTEVASAVEEMVSEGLPSPTSFEIETAVSFVLYKKWDVDYALVECGMGGRLDATNILEANVINVLASISFDHMQVLGSTLKEITREKLGIVRDGSVLITYPQQPEVMDEIMRYVIAHNVKLVMADPSSLFVINESIYGTEFIYKDETFKTSVGGQYQLYNAITAIEVLKEIAPVIDMQIIKSGIMSTKWDGRFQVVNNNPIVIIDGAHNEDAWLRLRDSLDKYFTNSRFVYIIGVLADKEYHKMIQTLGPTMSYVYATQSDSPRALAANDLANELISKGIDAEAYMSDVKSITDKAIAKYNELCEANIPDEERPEAVIICGTLSIVGDYIRCFDSAHQETDNE